MQIAMTAFKNLYFTVFAAVSLCLPVASAYAQSAFEDPGAVTSSDGSKAGLDLVAVEKSIDGGAIALGSASQVVVLFRNDAIKPVTAGDISLYPSSNVSASVSQNQCSLTPLESGAVCAVALNVKGLQPGKYRIEMLVKHDGRSRLLTSTISGNVETSGENKQDVISDVEAIPQTLDFGSLDQSHTMVRSVVLRNITSNPIDVTDVRIEANDQSGFNLQTNCDKLDTGQACIATVSWAPQRKGAATGMLILEHDGPTSVTSVPLDGKYEPATAITAEVFPEAVPGKGLLISTSKDINFGSNISASSSMTVSLVNVGDLPVTVQDLRLSNNESGVEIARTGCRPGTVLSPVEACALTLNWSPLREGALIDDIQVRHSGARGILVLPVRGSATRAVNKDSKAIVLNNSGYLGGIPSLLTTDLLDDDDLGDDAPASASSSDAPASSGKASTSRASSAAAPAAPRQASKPSDVQGILDGFSVTSLAPTRAIITGPGGSRVVFDGEETIIAGVLWTVGVKNSAVEFGNGNQKVLMLFDKSLSSVNLTSGGSGGATSGSGSVTPASSDTSVPAASTSTP